MNMWKTISAITLGLGFVGVAHAQTCPTLPYTLTNGSTADATQVMANFNAVRNCSVNSLVPRGYIADLTLSTAGSSSTFSVAPGQAADDGDTVLMNLSSLLNKTTAAWLPGSGNGALDALPIAATTWYHVYLIERPDTGMADILISTNPTTPALPTSYTLYRRIGSILTDASAHWVGFSQNGDEFLWKAPTVNLSNISTSATPMLVAVTTPTGLKTTAILDMVASNGSSGILATGMYSPDAGPPQFLQLYNPGGLGAFASTWGDIRTNTLSQIYVVSNQAGPSVYLGTVGWIDTRGHN